MPSPADDKSLLSVDTFVGDETSPEKIVCVRNKNWKKDGLTIIGTDTTISEEEIIGVYGKRWGIEVFLKHANPICIWVKECRSLSYDAITAHISIAFARYMMLPVTQRCNTEN